jgi:N-acetylmuramoyl-L-alanine amidase
LRMSSTRRGPGSRRASNGAASGAARLLALAPALLLLVWACAAHADVFSVQFDDGRTDRVRSIRADDTDYFRLTDVARAFGASRHWNPRTSKMSLAVGIHRLSMASGSQFVTLDSDAVNIGHQVLLRDGEFWVPERFLSSPLARAVNSEIGVSGVGSIVSVVKLGSVVTALDVEERTEGTAAILELNDRSSFVVSSRDRGRVDVFLPGATMVDSMYVMDGVGLVTSIEAERTEAGVSATVRTSPSATSYEAQMHTNPPRLEITLTSERREAVPAPLLKGSKSLLATGTGPMATDLNLGATVMIDPGHGGSDPGRVGRLGLVEKDVDLAIAEVVASKLRNEGFYVFMTRSSDSSVTPQRRAEIANLAGADIFISIHCGSWHSSAARGFRVTYYEPTRDYIVDKNAAGGRGLRRGNYGSRKADVSGLFWGDVQEGLVDDSRSLAHAIGDNMAELLPNPDRGVGGADVAVLAGCAMPAVLIEPAFISNTTDAELLADRDFLEKVGRAISRGVVEYHRTARGR